MRQRCWGGGGGVRAAGSVVATAALRKGKCSRTSRRVQRWASGWLVGGWKVSLTLIAVAVAEAVAIRH